MTLTDNFVNCLIPLAVLLMLAYFVMLMVAYLTEVFDAGLDEGLNE